MNFLVKVDGMDFKEAVELLLRENPAYIPPMPKEKESKPFVLPERYCNCRRVQEYLNQRGISDGVGWTFGKRWRQVSPGNNSLQRWRRKDMCGKRTGNIRS